MGEANIRFARGEREEAILMCMEIIRQGASSGVFLDNNLIVWLLNMGKCFIVLFACGN
jgi:hypothetical protein